VKYVYLIHSVADSGERHVGMTSDLKERLKQHNTGRSPRTSNHRPWELVVAVAFQDETNAARFEKYMKSGSGRAFAKRHFW
jgi:putative endonuclease